MARVSGCYTCCCPGAPAACWGRKLGAAPKLLVDANCGNGQVACAVVPALGVPPLPCLRKRALSRIASPTFTFRTVLRRTLCGQKKPRLALPMSPFLTALRSHSIECMLLRDAPLHYHMNAGRQTTCGAVLSSDECDGYTACKQGCCAFTKAHRGAGMPGVQKELLA